jgi:hypothetical protein
MSSKCPLCGQTLPAAIDEQSLHDKLDRMKIAAEQAAIRVAKRKLEEDFKSRLETVKRTAQEQATKAFGAEAANLRKQLSDAAKNTAKLVADARRSAGAEAERLMKGQLLEVNKKLLAAEKRTAVEVAKAKREATESVKETERLKHAGELIKLRAEVEKLNRQLEKKSGEQFGEEGEVDLFNDLTRVFRTDQIERIGRGVKGADILHKVMDGTRVAGCIIYESKNVTAWQNAFIEQAKKYHAHYETPYVMVVSRVFPRKQRGMCVVDNVPVVEPRLATTLAVVMREGILEIAKLRLTRVDANEKARELFEYVIGNEFQTRFCSMASAVESLKDLQQSERTWHENHWVKQGKFHSQIEARHREINSRVQFIVKEGTGRKPLANGRLEALRVAELA